MPLFEVNLAADQSTCVMRARTKKLVRETLQHQHKEYTSIVQKRRCVFCRKSMALATVQNTLCQPCWDQVLTHCRIVWQDIDMTEQALQDLAMSFFVDA